MFKVKININRSKYLFNSIFVNSFLMLLKTINKYIYITKQTKLCLNFNHLKIYAIFN